MKPKYTVLKADAPDWSQIPAVALQETGWLPPADIDAQAQLCHDGQRLWVRLVAREAAIRATATGELDSVCQDSCLEFFLAPLPGDVRYFNFEYNLLGTLYLGFGAERATRARQILRDPKELFRPEPFQTEDGWGIVYQIPLSFLQMYFPGFAFSGEAACNFYKCGDRTEQPHYLAWSPLTCDKPDYHRRQDFGVLCFQ